MYRFIRALLFLLKPETSHYFALACLNWTPACCFKKLKDDPIEVMGLNFPNRIGLAAGFDKNADYIDAFAKLGFGFIEVGTVTPKPQEGNPLPRLFRIPEHLALINRMGFNNKGVDYLVEQLNKTKFSGIIGINIGKNKQTPLESAIDDYLYCFRKVYSVASYVTVNLSSPNTPDLRKLQHGQQLIALLSALKEEQSVLEQQYKRYVPLVVKIAPDLSEAEIVQIAEILLQSQIDGVIATNTTVDKSSLSDSPNAHQAGGLSGQPLAKRSTEVIKLLSKSLADQIPIIGVGGIESAEDIKQKSNAGAILFQVYTGLIYQGPWWLTKL